MGLADGEHAQPAAAVVKVADFGDRFWVDQILDQRTDSFVELGATYHRPSPAATWSPAAFHGPSSCR